jgi:ABC-type lipoprotein export system ATPase subunit
MNTMLSLNDLSFFYESDYPLIKDLSYLFDQHSATAIVGPSGCGKTTLLHLIAGLIEPHKGSVVIEGQILSTLTATKRTQLLAETFSFVFSRPFLIQELTVFENIYLGQSLSQDQRVFFEEQLACFDLADKLHHYPSVLSSGQQQRVCVLRALMRPSLCILADEPTAHLDKSRSVLLMKHMIEVLKAQNRGLICVTHDLNLIPLFDRVLQLGS